MQTTRNWSDARFTVIQDDASSHQITVAGRDRWALECLIAAGSKGCTPIETPGPRWSAYVFNLRAMGVDIETLTEPHDGPFSGHHARYVLRGRVERARTGETA